MAFLRHGNPSGPAEESIVASPLGLECRQARSDCNIEIRPI